MRYFIIIIFALEFSFCSENKTVQNAANKTHFSDLSFDFSFDHDTVSERKNAGFISPSDFGKGINCYIYNKGVDAVYFLNSTCEGSVYRVRYDRSNFSIEPMIYCNAAWNCIDTIPPKRRFNFFARFKNKGTETSFKLGFKFVELVRGADISKIEQNSSFYSWDLNAADILWSEKKPIR